MKVKEQFSYHYNIYKDSVKILRNLFIFVSVQNVQVRKCIKYNSCFLLLFTINIVKVFYNNG